MQHATTIAVPTATDPRFHALAFLARYQGNTRETYAVRLRLFLTWCDQNALDPIHGVTRSHLEVYARHLEEERGNCRASVHGSLCVLKMFYRLLHIDNVIVSSPAEYVRMPKVHRDEIKVLGLQRSDFMSILFAAQRMSPDHAALASLLGKLGLRVSEACAVRLEDFGEERGHKVVRVVGKGGKPATIPITVAVWRDLEPCMQLRGGTAGPLLMRIDGVTPLDRRAAYRMIKAVAREAGVKARVTPHVLRHSWVTAALDAGVPLRDVQIGARHADPRTTAYYDQARQSLDRHANHAVSSWLSGGGG